MRRSIRLGAVALAIVAVGVAVLATWRGLPPLPLPFPLALKPPREAGELVVLMRPGAATWFVGPEGAPAGFDVDLIRRFADEQKLPLRLIVAESATAMAASIARGKAHVGAGGIFRPRPVAAPKASARKGTAEPTIAPPAAGSTATTAGSDAAGGVLWTVGYHEVAPVLIFNEAGYRPSTWRDLEGATIAYVEGTGLADELDAIRRAHPEVRWQPLTLPSADALIAQVSDGTVSYALVASNEAAVARNIYLDFDVGFTAGAPRQLAWMVPDRFAPLAAELDAFLARVRRDGTLARLTERYFTHARQVARPDAGILQERIRTLLPQYRALFHDAQEATGIEWRLLAAVAYQESQWDPQATSETGVRGLMQLTEDTARHLGVTDRLDPRAATLAAARYLADLKAKLPERIQEPDRTWLALAAFNIGLGHLEDARVLAQKQGLNPDLWADVKKTLPLLAQPEYYEQVRLGYARGGMPVAFVDKVRAYYDVLLAREPPSRLRLRSAPPAMRLETPSPPGR
jgi:membrane-bound lytic murein transglycosylase F